MKTKLCSFLFVVCIGIAATAQNSIPNGNFETWDTASYIYPQFYPYNSNVDNFYRQLPFNLTQSTDAYHGIYAVQIATVAVPPDTNFGYFVNTNPNNGNPMSWTGGIAINEKPSGIRGYYKYNVASGDSATLIAAFSKAGSNIGTYFTKIGGLHTSYNLFSFTFNPPLSVTPDSVALAAASSNVLNGHPHVGSILIIDSISFTGITSQPADMNGDFELWQSQTLSKPVDWYVQSNPQSIIKSTDKYVGNYALELITFLGNMHNHAAAQPGQISTGYWNQNCYCMKGGYAFTQQIDTLVFHYKYTAATATDSAVVFVNFIKNGADIGGINKNIGAAATYQYVEMPFNTLQAPDTAVVSVQSATWNDTLVSSVGSDLIIDEIHFKSQPLNTGIFEIKPQANMLISPNPVTGEFNIMYVPENTGSATYAIIDEMGRLVKNNKVQSGITRVDLSGYPKGLYFLRIDDGGTVITKKIIVQ